MKFWTTGRIDIKVEFELFQPALRKVSDNINHLIAAQDYGDLISSYDIIVNIFEEKVDEKFWYISKTKETNIDVTIDHDDFLKTDPNGRYILYLKSVLYSIEKMKLNKKLKDFNFDLFHKTVASLMQVS